MTSTYSTGLTSVTGNVSATVSTTYPTAGSDQTLIQASTSGNGTTTVYTVPANKILYLLTANVASSAGASWILYNGAAAALLSGNYTANGSNPFSVNWKYTAGMDVNIYSSVAATKEIIGVLVNA